VKNALFPTVLTHRHRRLYERLPPASHLLGKRTRILAEPQQRLNLLILEDLEVALELLDAKGVMGPDIFGQRALVRRLPADYGVAGYCRKGRRQMGTVLIGPVAATVCAPQGSQVLLSILRPRREPGRCVRQSRSQPSRRARLFPRP